MSFQVKYMKFGNVCSISNDTPIDVLPNLAITPSQMARLVEDGIPVSTNVLGVSAFDGENNPSWDLPVDMRRGVDVADVWSAQRSARDRITNRVEIKSNE